MATRDGLAQIWYADANGVVTGYTPNADNVASAIIDTYNEHYGTDIGIWTPETKSLQVGGTVPNWNAYEKIEMPVANNLFKLKHADGQYFFMQLIDGILTVSGQGLNVYVYDDTTGYQSASGLPKNTFLNELGDKLQYSSIVVRNLEDNYQIPNFENYVEI